MALPTILSVLKVPPPVFIRKLGRCGHWGAEDDDIVTRSNEVALKIFRGAGDLGISMYRVNTDDDLRRVVLGLNTARGSLTENVPLVGFAVAELNALHIEARLAPGNLPCPHANSLHYDLVAADEQLADLCRSAMEKGRVASNCSQGMMKDVLDLAKKEQCRSAITDGQCSVPVCATEKT